MESPNLFIGRYQFEAATYLAPRLYDLMFKENSNEKFSIVLEPGEYFIVDIGLFNPERHKGNKGHYYCVSDKKNNSILGWQWYGILHSSTEGINWLEVPDDFFVNFSKTNYFKTISHGFFLDTMVNLEVDFPGWQSLLQLHGNADHILYPAGAYRVIDAFLYCNEQGFLFPALSRGIFYLIESENGNRVWTWQYFLEKAIDWENIDDNDIIWKELSELDY